MGYFQGFLSGPGTAPGEGLSVRSVDENLLCGTDPADRHSGYPHPRSRHGEIHIISAGSPSLAVAIAALSSVASSIQPTETPFLSQAASKRPTRTSRDPKHHRVRIRGIHGAQPIPRACSSSGLSQQHNADPSGEKEISSRSAVPTGKCAATWCARGENPEHENPEQG